VAINPTRIEFTASPGQKLAGSFKFWNGTDNLLPVHLEATDFAPQDEEGHILVEGGEDRASSLKDWVHPTYPDLTVFPKQEITLDFSIDVPVYADPGSHWGTVLVVTVPVSSGNGAAIQSRIALLLLVRVLGDVREQMTLESFSAPRFLQGPPVVVAARFRNEGTVHEAPVADIEIRNMFGTLVATGTLPMRNVLPGAVRKIEESVEESVGQGLWLGRYTATLRASYGDGTQILTAKEIIWVVPWKQYGVHFLVGMAITAFVVWKRRRFGKVWYALRTGKPPPED